MYLKYKMKGYHKFVHKLFFHDTYPSPRASCAGTARSSCSKYAIKTQTVVTNILNCNTIKHKYNRFK